MLPACRRRGRSRCSLLVAVPVDVVCGLGLGGPQCCVASVSHVVLRGGRTHYHPLSAPNAKKRVGNQHWGPKRCLSTCAHAVYDSVRYTVYNYCNFQRKFAVERKMSYIRSHNEPMANGSAAHVASYLWGWRTFDQLVEISLTWSNPFCWPGITGHSDYTREGPVKLETPDPG